MPDEDVVAVVRRVTAQYEREFRLRMFQADNDEDRRQAEFGLRHAIGFRTSVEKLSSQPVAVAAAGQ